MDKIQKIQRAFARMDEAVNNAESTQVFKNVSSHTSEQQIQKPLDDFSMRQQRDWGKIANQVVGAESQPEYA